MPGDWLPVTTRIDLCSGSPGGVVGYWLVTPSGVQASDLRKRGYW